MLSDLLDVEDGFLNACFLRVRANIVPTCQHTTQKQAVVQLCCRGSVVCVREQCACALACALACVRARVPVCVRVWVCLCVCVSLCVTLCVGVCVCACARDCKRA